MHLAVQHGSFLAMLDLDLFLPEGSWDADRKRGEAAHIPDDIAYRPKWLIALEQVKRAVANGVRFDWLTFDEGYGGKPEFLFLLEGMGINYVAEVPRSFMCWATKPKYHSLQRPFAAKRVENAAAYGKPFWGAGVADGEIEAGNACAADVEGQGRAGASATGRPADRADLLADRGPQRRDRGGEVLRLQRPAENGVADAAEGGLLPVEGRACVLAGQDRDRFRAFRGKELEGVIETPDLVPGGDAVRGRANDSAPGGKIQS